jgi:hypothetical protein
MSYPIFGNLSLGNVSGNIKLFVNHSGIGNLTGIGYNNNAMTFGVNQSASATPEMIINRIGDVDILGNVFTGGNVVVNAIAPSTSTTTGALRVAGGVGIQGNIFLGGNLRLNRDIDCNGNIQIDGTTSSVSTTTGALVVAGGAGIVGNVYTGGNVVIQSIVPSTTITTGALQVAGGAGIVGNVYTGGNVVINSTTSSTSITTGALQVAGGAGIVGNVYTGGNVVINAVVPSTSITTGALQVAGGAGIVGNVYTGGNVVIQAIDPSTSMTTGALQVAGGAGIVGNVYTGGNVIIQAIDPSTSITTGALQVAGGAGIVGNIYTGGNVVIQSIDPSTSITTGALQVAGGAGIVGNVYTGGNVVIQAIEPSTNITTGALQVAGGAGIVGNVYTGGNVVIQAIEPSTNITTGALQVAGGAGIVGNIYTGGNVIINATTLSTSTATGALQVAGGAGIQGNLNIGLDSFFNGNVQLTQTNNPLWFVSNNASTINSTLASGSDVGIFYGPTNPAAAGLVISPRGIGGGIKMSISGNVGINTITPRFTLDVNGIIGIQNDNDNKKLVLYDNAPTDNPNTATNFYGFGINSGMLRYQVDTPAATHGFYGGSTEYMRIVAGNVGIGTTTPQARLDVTSTGQNTVTIHADDVSNNNSMKLIGNLSAGGFNSISQNNDVGIIYGRSSGSSGSIVIAPWVSGFIPSGIRMDSNGNMGIGKASPLSALDVSGTLRLNAPITQSLGSYSVGTTPASTQIGYSFTTTTGPSPTLATAFNALNAVLATGVSIPVAGVWLINYIGALSNTASTLSAGSVAFGLSFTANNVSATTAIATSRIPTVSGAIYGGAGVSNISLQGSYIYTGASTTVYLNCNVGSTAGLAVATSSLTATRIA